VRVLDDARDPRIDDLPVDADIRRDELSSPPRQVGCVSDRQRLTT
jgi:hypothetical protein